MSLQATVVKDILYTATTYGSAYDSLRQMAGFTEYEIGDSNFTVEWQKAAHVWDILADVFESEQIGLYLGRDVNINMLGMVGFMMQSCKTIEEAIETYVEYGYMVCPMIPMKYKRENGRAIIEFHQNGMWKSTYERNARIGMDFSFAGTVNFTRALCGKPVSPIITEVAHAKTGVDAYNEVLDCNILFDAPLDRMIYREEDALLPIVSSDTSLYETFKNILSMKKTVFMQQSCSAALKNLLFMQFKGQIPTVEEAAGQMDMTVRTLQRKLMDENTSYRNIANEVKKELALQLMKSANATEVAEVLGYSDLPAFRRAFKSWTSTTPRELKKSLKAEKVQAA